MTTVYFDSSVFLAVLAKQPEAAKVKALLAELRADRIRIYTSILTIQEVSVSSFSHGGIFGDYHSKIARLARVKGVTREIALTAAKYEAEIIADARKHANAKREREADNKRRTFDCFHLATAVSLGCGRFYAFDRKFAPRAALLGLGLMVVEPEPMRPKLPGLLGTPAGSGPSSE